MKYGVQFFCILDELKQLSTEAQFVVFYDFDFSNFTVEDVKRFSIKCSKNNMHSSDTLLLNLRTV
jgi:hypothetical protein